MDLQHPKTPTQNLTLTPLAKLYSSGYDSVYALQYLYIAIALLIYCNNNINTLQPSPTRIAMNRHRVAPLIPLVFALAASTTKAADWGCEVLLCLANPAGPMAVAPCVPPITRLWREMARLRFTFPTCAMASGPNGRSWAQLDSNYYDGCPSGTQVLPAGSIAIRAPSPLALPAAPTYWSGIGDGVGLMPSIDGPALSSKVCVANPVGMTYVTIGAGDSTQSVPAGIYKNVTIIDPATSPSVVNVFIDSSWYRSVRF